MSEDAVHLPFRQASTPFSIILKLLNSPIPNQGLTGGFLFASTTARSSSALLGWNCGYALFSNVSGPDSTQTILQPPSFFLLMCKLVGHVRRSLCCLCRNLPSPPPRHGKWTHWICGTRFWRLSSSFPALLHERTDQPSRTYDRHLSSLYMQTSILPYLYTSLVDSSLAPVALRYYCRSNRGVKHRYKFNYDLVLSFKREKASRKADVLLFFCESLLAAGR